MEHNGHTGTRQAQAVVAGFWAVLSRSRIINPMFGTGIPEKNEGRGQSFTENITFLRLSVRHVPKADGWAQSIADETNQPRGFKIGQKDWSKETGELSDVCQQPMQRSDYRPGGVDLSLSSD